MSWSFFNKRKPTLKLNVDREFERDVAKCNQLETNTKKLYKDMKRCNESLAELSKTEEKIAQDLYNWPLKQGKVEASQSEELGKTFKSLESYRRDLATNIVKTNIEPMKKLSGVFQNVNNGVKKREQCLQEYGRIKAKVERYKDREKTQQNLSKLEQYNEELEHAKSEYEAHNTIMLEELPRLADDRVTYFQPCFDALQKSQVDYYSKCCQAYGDLVEAMNHGIDHATGNDTHPQSTVQEMLSEFHTLSIVGHV